MLLKCKNTIRVRMVWMIIKIERYLERQMKEKQGMYNNKCNCYMIIILALFVTSRADSTSIVYSYDHAGRIAQIQPMGGQTHVYQYDLVGNRTYFQQGSSTTDVGDQDDQAFADLDHDGSVTVDDLAILRGAYGTESGSGCFVAEADLDRSGLVDLADLFLWYEGYTQGSWIPGDWTEGPASPTVAWSASAPDGRVDFFDLAALASDWGQVAGGSPAAYWLDIAPNVRDDLINENDLATFRANWLTSGDPIPAVTRTVDCIPSGSEEAPALAGALLAIRSRDSGHADAKPVMLDIVLTGATSDLTSFQLLLDSDLDLGLDDAQGLPESGTASIWLGGGNAQDQAGHFLDVRSVDGGTLITGAFLDLPQTATSESRILCSIAVPRIEDERRLAVHQALCGVSSGAVYRLSDWSGEVTLNPVPPVPVLLQNRPNPFNPTTTLKYAVPAEAMVKLHVYDLQGRLVRELVNQAQERGWHESLWDGRAGDGRSVASGLYFYKMQVGAETLTGKMSLVR